MRIANKQGKFYYVKWFTTLLLLLMSVVISAFIIDHALFWRLERDTIVNRARIISKSTTHDDRSILFIGDSIIDNFPIAAHIGNKFKYYNFGISGYSIKQIVQKYFDIKDKIRRDFLIVEGGINDILGYELKKRLTENELKKIIIDSFSAIILTELLANKDSKIIILSITPVTKNFLFPYIQLCSFYSKLNTSETNLLINRINAELKYYCDSFRSTRVLYLDISSVLKDKDELSREYGTADGYHINQIGYEIISAHLLEAIASCPAE